MKSQKGFTLIELLVVIAIIGILSSVVLASLNTARDKGADAAAKANLNNARAQAELYYDDRPGNYIGICSAADGLAPAIQAAEDATGNTAECALPTTGVAWGAEIPLKDGTFYCVDSSGVATTTTASTITAGTSSSDYLCGSATTI